MEVWHDLRYAVRGMRRSPGFTAVAVLTTAVGIGATSAIFSIVNSVLLRPLPYPHPEELVVVDDTDRATKQHLADATPANFLDWRRRNHSFEALAAYTPASLTLAAAGMPERIDGAMVNANFFDVLGVGASAGRVFTPDDERPGAPRVAVIGDGLWRRRFGAASRHDRKVAPPERRADDRRGHHAGGH